MLVSSQVSSLLGTTTSSTSLNTIVGGLLNPSSKDIGTATQNLLGLSYGLEPASIISFTDDLKQFITENLDEEKAGKLLADLAAIEQLSTFGQDDTDPGNVVNILA